MNDLRVDAYIAKAGDFAKPILTHLRKLVHKACPEVEETIKWGFPFFLHKGMLCSMAAFKAHCAFGFWQRKLVMDGDEQERGMGQFGEIKSLADLPSDKVLLGYIEKAARLNENGIKPVRVKPSPKKKLKVPEYLVKALKGNSKAQATWDGLSYSHRKEYIEWLAEAKRNETRARRLETTLQWLSQGKARNWKYM